ncbi:Transposase insE for insertion sequence IS3 [Erwinia piriflorinigrans CFBP 5888]|uniref:Transposase insE for insertion sequence IS3 n=1 Tax=Erwinia piriflorinigrans CFBP 5888 TaxID=1161919 RepID=V5Z8T4_9GAMM|nr:Transposase insE for insertion sequence IS3 [Erwinia piriflorinigrans CFBP 5888]
MTHITKSASISKKPHKQHMPEFRYEALKLAERISAAAAARELSPYDSNSMPIRNWRHAINRFIIGSADRMSNRL